MSGVPEKREYLKGIYSNQTWYDKVDNMPDHQVMAIYYRFQQKPPLLPSELSQDEPNDDQLSLF